MPSCPVTCTSLLNAVCAVLYYGLMGPLAFSVDVITLVCEALGVERRVCVKVAVCCGCYVLLLVVSLVRRIIVRTTFGGFNNNNNTLNISAPLAPNTFPAFELLLYFEPSFSCALIAIFKSCCGLILGLLYFVHCFLLFSLTCITFLTQYPIGVA
jgi:hypothetical protein